MEESKVSTIASDKQYMFAPEYIFAPTRTLKLKEITFLLGECGLRIQETFLKNNVPESLRDQFKEVK